MARIASKSGNRAGQHARLNEAAGTVDVTTDVSGDGVAVVTFPTNAKFKNIPLVQITPYENVSGAYFAASRTLTGFVVSVDNAQQSVALTFGYHAVDPRPF